MIARPRPADGAAYIGQITCSTLVEHLASRNSNRSVFANNEWILPLCDGVSEANGEKDKRVHS